MKLTTHARPSAQASTGSVLQRQCACGNHALGGMCASCRLRHSEAQAERVPAIVHDVLSTSGHPLDPMARADLGARFDYDFSSVQVHADERAGASAQAVGALAYTVGNHIVFGPGAYQPSTGSGRRLLIHELTHTIQQSRGGASQFLPATLKVSSATDPAEQKARHTAEADTQGQPFIPPVSKLDSHIARQQAVPIRASEKAPEPEHPLSQLRQAIGNCGSGRIVQARLKVGQSGDVYEQEADRVADQVMRMPDPSTETDSAVSEVNGSLIRRMCQECEDEMQPNSVSGTTPEAGPRLESGVDSVRTGGEPIPASLRGFFEPRFGYDFGQVRLHTGTAASEIAQEARAQAFTVGRNIVFGAGQYTPETESGKKLLAHELTHVVQQRHATFSPSINQVGDKGPAPGPFVSAPAPMLSRADPQVATIGMNLGTAPRSGLQFSPTNVTDTQLGPVSVQGGLLSGGASRLHVIVAENETIRRLARQLRPLFLIATPFTPVGAVAPLPLPIVTEDELAQALLVYNQYYLPVPAMTNWRSGLNFPLPIEIDAITGMATLHPLLIRALSGGFSAAWTPLLDSRATGTVAPPAATLQADVTAFLLQEPTALGRGIHLGARAVTNPIAELPFVRETFRQLGAGAFDVALEFMDNLLNPEIELLAAQRDGSAILTEIRNALGGAPGGLSAAQTASLARANLMLGRVAAAVAVAAPLAARSRAEKTATIDTVQLDGSNHSPAVDVAVANALFTQCNVRLAHGVDATATPVQTRAWLGGNTDLRASPACGAPTAEERRMFVGASNQFNLTGRLRAFFVASYSGYPGGVAYSHPAYCAGAAPTRGMIIIQNASGKGDLAHEGVHVLRNSAEHRPDPNLMGSNPLSVQLNDAQCTDIYNKV